MHRKCNLVAILGGLFTAASGPGFGVAEAATTTAFGVSVTITAGCTASVANLTFASPGEWTGNADSRGPISVKCTNTAPYSLAVDRRHDFAPPITPVSALLDRMVTATITY
jgi:spore coat protein U-like protein